MAGSRGRGKDVAIAVSSEGETATMPSPISPSKSFKSRAFGDERTGLQITLFRLMYCVPGRKRKDEPMILLGGYRKLSCVIDPGQLVALMGASGAGKTTLLDVICHRKTIGEVSGHVLYGNEAPTVEEIKRDTGYVEQFESLWDVLTVHEMLLYTAFLNMPNDKFTTEQKEARVTEVIEQLGLKGAKDTRIGGAMVRGIGSGEAKRVSVGIGLINNPRAIFFDEPTTGLDSATAHDVMVLIQGLAQEGRTVLATVHQPSGQVYDFFDTVLLLSRDVDTKSGNVVYFGPGREAVSKYFTRLGYKYSSKVYDNIPEFFTELVGGGVTGPGEGNKLIEAYENSNLFETNYNTASGIAQSTAGNNNALQKSERLVSKRRSLFANSFWEETLILIKFKAKAEYRDGFFLVSRIVIYLVTALMLDTLYAGQQDTPTSIIVVLVLFHIVVLIQGCITIIYIPDLIISKPTFVRETFSGMYRVASYCTSRIVIESSAMLIAVIGYSCILYWAIGGVMNESAGAFFFFILNMFVFSLAAMTATFALTAPFPSIELAIGVVAIYMLLNIALLGFLNAVPPWWGWFTYLSIMRWGWNAFMINNFRGQSLDVCGDVTEPLSTPDILNTIEMFSDLSSVFQSPDVTDGLIDFDNLACGVLDTAIKNRGEFMNQTCPAVPSFLDASAMKSFNCSEQFISVVTEGMNMTEEGFDSEVGNVILSLYPLGSGYDATTKLISMNQWHCLGYLVLLWVAHCFVYYLTSLLSLKLLKR